MFWSRRRSVLFVPERIGRIECVPRSSGGGLYPGAWALLPMSSYVQDLRGPKSSGTGGRSQGSSPLFPESLHEGESELVIWEM